MTSAVPAPADTEPRPPGDCGGQPWAWSWWRTVVPLLAALAVFSLVLLSTPPGFAAISEVLFTSPRGASADAAAYALGAAASLALVALLGVAALCTVIELLCRRR
jgi:hypothetical protein